MKRKFIHIVLICILTFAFGASNTFAIATESRCEEIQDIDDSLEDTDFLEDLILVEEEEKQLSPSITNKADKESIYLPSIYFAIQQNLLNHPKTKIFVLHEQFRL